MQRATGQYNHLARVPRTGPRQSGSRRSFASRHCCRAAPRRTRGMEPTVRSAWIKSAIGSDPARSSLLSRPNSRAPAGQPSRNSVAGNGIFGCRDWRPRTRPRDRYSRQRPGTLKIGNKNPRGNGPFSIDDGFRSSGGLDGGVRSHMRTGLHLQFPANREINIPVRRDWREPWQRSRRSWSSAEE